MPNPQVLLVSADRPALRQLSRFLELFGYPVIQAADAELAVTAAIGRRPEIVLVDDDLGGHESLELARYLRQQDCPEHPFLVILLTSEPRADRFIQALEAGVDDFLGKPVVYGELLARLRAAARVLQAERRFADAAHVDGLTGLASRGAVRRELERHLGDDQQAAVSLILVDLDCVDFVNRSQGRQGGDRLLRQVAEELAKLQSGDELVARWRDDCFAVVLPHTSDVRAAAWAERARRALNHIEFETGDAQSLRVTASFGVAGSSHGALNAEELLAQARQALDSAKRSGRNCVVRQGEFTGEDDRWQELAAPGRLFEGTVARDVMAPCALVAQHDDNAQEVADRMRRGGLDVVAVVDADGKLAGLVHEQDLGSRPPRATARIADYLRTEPPVFTENEPFKTLFDFFVEDARSHAVVVRDRVPLGIVSRESLAALIEIHDDPAGEVPTCDHTAKPIEFSMS